MAILREVRVVWGALIRVPAAFLRLSAFSVKMGSFFTTSVCRVVLWVIFWWIKPTARVVLRTALNAQMRKIVWVVFREFWWEEDAKTVAHNATTLTLEPAILVSMVVLTAVMGTPATSVRLASSSMVSALVCARLGWFKRTARAWIVLLTVLTASLPLISAPPAGHRSCFTWRNAWMNVHPVHTKTRN